MTNGSASETSANASRSASLRSSNLRWWFIAVPLAIIALIGQIDKLAISVVMTNRPFLQDLNLIGKPAVAGMFMSGFLFSYAICHFFWGPAVKKYGPRLSAIVGLIAWGVAMVLSGLALTSGHMIAARVILGVFEAFTLPVFNAFVANWFPVKERARASAFWYNGITLAPVVAGAVVVAIIGAGGWRWVFFILAALSICLPLPLLIFLMKDHPRQQPRLSRGEMDLIEEGSLARTKEVPKTGAAPGKEGYLRNYRFWLVTAAFAFNNVFFFGWATWMPTYFQNARHFSFQSAGYIYSLSFLFAVIAIAIVGYLSDRVMRRAPFGAVGWITAAILFWVGGQVVANPYWALVILIVALCFQQPCFLMIHAMLQSIVPEDLIGAATGVSGGISLLVAAVAPALIGLLLQISGFGAVILFLSLASLIPGLLYCILTREGY